MPPRLKATPKPVARRRGIVTGEASREASESLAGTVIPITETIGPTPTAPIIHAPPPGRLDSLAPQPKPPIGVLRGNSSGLKFKPKVIARKSKEERDAIAAKFEASATPAPYEYKSRGLRGGRGGGRGRGRDGHLGYVPATASGPFALGSVDSGRRKEGAVERGSNFTKHRKSIESEVTRIGKSKMKNEDGKEIHYSSSDDSDDARMDIELIGYLDESEEKLKDDEGDQEMDDNDKIWGAGAPLRVPRSQHLELKSSVNTDSSSKTDKGVKKGKSNVEFETSIKIKDEPIDEDITLPDLDSPPLTPSTPKATKKGPEVLGQQFKEEVEMEELDRQATLREMIGDFSGVKTDQEDFEMKFDITGNKKINMEVDNQIFCFQFPEILPQLVSYTKDESGPDPLVPDEGATKSAPPSNTPISLKQQKLSAKAQQMLLESFPPSGVAGKLRIHKSGRISILWGSPDGKDGPIDFDVNRGSTMGFLQEAVIIKQNSPWGEQDVDEKGRQKGAAFSLGQVKGKFIVCPDFSRLVFAEKSKKEDVKGKEKMVNIIHRAEV